MARRLVEAGVNLVQVNLGNNETWDTHGNAFPQPEGQPVPADRPGRVGPARRPARPRPARTTLIVMAGEFGRTPKIIARCRSTTSCPAATTGGRCRRCSSPAAASRAARWSARPTRSAATRPPTRRRRRTWPRRSTRRSGLPQTIAVERRARPPAPRLPRRADPRVDLISHAATIRHLEREATMCQPRPFAAAIVALLTAHLAAPRPASCRRLRCRGPQAPARLPLAREARLHELGRGLGHARRQPHDLFHAGHRPGQGPSPGPERRAGEAELAAQRGAGLRHDRTRPQERPPPLDRRAERPGRRRAPTPSSRA